jgi:signal transduction histidine kinase/DNA-binding NarL/FixJ family response regulator
MTNPSGVARSESVAVEEILGSDRSDVVESRAGARSDALILGGGEMGERTRILDWSLSAVGPVEGWSYSLKTAVSICLGSRHPIVILWGPSYTQFYNDAYIPVLGAKHPEYLGRSGQQCWSEIWPVIGPMLEGVYRTGQGTWAEDLQLILRRHLPQEESYFTFSQSPIRDDEGQIGGIFCACNETTARVVGERRLRTLGDLNRVAAEARTATSACEGAARILSDNPGDIPFALIYLLEDDASHASLIAASGLERGSAAAPETIELDAPRDTPAWPLNEVLATGAAQRVSDVEARFGRLPGGLWPESPQEALIVAVAAPGHSRPTGFLICGLSPRRIFDAHYKSFLELVAGHIGTSIYNARAYEAERRRAEMLAQLDKAKTTFFSNISHEFRTPLTLILGPLEDELRESPREGIQLAHRNVLRLLKLVNTLLDFSSIEAGRLKARYEPVDLPSFTADLASVFRSAIEKAKLRLVVHCPPTAVPVYVDRGMWERIVLNLLSNAYKFTFEGQISVSLVSTSVSAVLCVTDTGIGIPSNELPRLFERFHRVEGARGRTFEGSGIGLALIQELAKLHGGVVSVESKEGKGSSFTVSIPLGCDHLPREHIVAPAPGPLISPQASAYTEETLRWLPDADTGDSPAPAMTDRQESKHPRARILFADDNADLRQYVKRLLSAHHDIQLAGNGEAALAAARANPPDLVLADVMMPALDGFGLLRALRVDASTKDIPVILLSARAGEESRLEGLQAGAADYLVKPFARRELLARIDARLEIARLNRANLGREQQLRTAAEESESRMRDELLAELGAMNRLHELSTRWLASSGLEKLLQEILDSTIALLNADFGTIQLYEKETQTLKIVTQRGFGKQFLSHFSHVHEGTRGCACARALQTRSRAIIEDVLADPEFEPHLAVALEAGYRAVQSTPLISRSGELLGILTTHFRRPHRPSQRDLRLLDLYSHQAAELIDHRRAEDSLQKLQAELAHVTRIATMGEMASSIAHEVNQPLAAIIANADACARWLSKEPMGLQEANAAIARIVRDATRANAVIGRIRAFVQRREMQRGPIDLTEVTREAISMADAEIRKHDISLSFTPATELPCVIADRVQVQQVILNLLKNGVEAMESVSDRKRTLDVKLDTYTGDALRLAIRDCGVGIDQSQRKRVFETFHSTKPDGMGMGLAISRSIIEAHSGQLWMSDNDGPGVTFQFTLPTVTSPRDLISA